jgi:hypothetical protein
MQTDAQIQPSKSAKKKFRAGDFYPKRSAMNADIETVPFDNMTHIISKNQNYSSGLSGYASISVSI